MHPTSSYTTKPQALIFAILFFCLGSGFSILAQTPTISKSFTLNGPGVLNADLSGGGISVEGTSGNSVEIALFIKKNNKLISPSDPFLERLKEGYEIKMEKNGNTIEIYSKRISQAKEWQRMSLNFNLKVPEQMAGNIQTSGGGIKLANLAGKQNIRTSGGGIKMSEISGPVKAVTSGGGIQVSQQTGEVELISSGGGISVTNAEGNIVANTSGGGVHLKDISGTVDARSSGGRIDIKGEVGSVKAVTSGGGIQVDITGLREKMYLKTSGGGIKATIPAGLDLDLDLKALKVNVDLPRNFSGNRSKNSVTGKINNGGISLYMHASGGNVTCAFR